MIPGGDATTRMLAQSVEGDDNYFESHNNNDGVIRGRVDFSQVGRLRTKPGRVDSETTNSMSCRFAFSHPCLNLAINWQNGISSGFKAPY